MDHRTTAELIEALESTALLGRGLEQASTLRNAITQRLTREPDPALQLRAQLRFGELLVVLDAPDAGAFLEELARLADQRDAQRIAARACLLAVRAACRAGDRPRGQALLERCAHALGEHPELAPDALLAEAWLGAMDGAAKLGQAIDVLPPSRDHDRLAALLELADRCELGGDPYRARDALERAFALALGHDAHGPAGRAALLLGSLQLRSGELDAARASLARALPLATRAGDSLVTATAGMLVVTLALAQRRWEDALAASEPLPAVARQRHNPGLLASISLDRATALWALDRPVEALAALMACSAELAPHPRPLELIRARFAELLEEVGVERFGALVTEAAGLLRSA